MSSFLICRMGGRRCALALSHVVETMRPRPVEPLASMPPFVMGLAMIRGASVVVVDGSQLASRDRATPTRFVTIRSGERVLALAVDDVTGVRSIPGAARERLPPLVQPSNQDVVTAIATLDAGLVLVLDHARIVPDDVWAALEKRAS